MIQRKIGVGIVLVCLVFLLPVLAACGDTPTATPLPTTAAATTAAAAATTARATSAAATTAAAAGGAATTAATSNTTAAATTSAATTAASSTTAVATTAAATTASSAATTAASSAGGSFSLPTISGLTEVKLDPAISAEIAKQSPVFSNATIKVYVSDNTADTVSNDLDTALIQAGYQFAIPGSTKPQKQGDGYSGLYVKQGGSDVIFSAGAVPTNEADLTQNMNIPGLSAAAMQDFVSQVKGKKTAVFLIAAPNLVQNLFASAGSSSSSTTTAGAGSASPTPTK